MPPTPMATCRPDWQARLLIFHITGHCYSDEHYLLSLKVLILSQASVCMCAYLCASARAFEEKHLLHEQVKTCQ